MGVAVHRQLSLAAESMARLGVRRAFVVRGSDGLDELTITGESTLAEVRDRAVGLYRTKPQDAGLDIGEYAELRGGDAAANAAVLERIFHGEKGPRRDIVLLNAAAALVVAELSEDLAGEFPSQPRPSIPAPPCARCSRCVSSPRSVMTAAP